MKLVIATILCIGFFFSVSAAEEKLDLKSQRDKESYSFGYQFGQNLKSQGMDINVELYSSGIRDALNSKEPLLSKEEISKTISELQKRIMTTRQKEFKEMADKNLAEGKAFLEQNKKKEGIKTLSSGLQYKILTKGSGKTPNVTDNVTVHYRGTFINGSEFDSSYKRGKPETFQVSGVIRGWTEALQLMQAGSKWQLFVPYELGYGERGAGPIPPNSTLIFEVELISIKSTK